MLKKIVRPGATNKPTPAVKEQVEPAVVTEAPPWKEDESPVIDAESGAIVLKVPEGIEEATATNLRQSFDSLFKEADEWRAKALGIKVAGVDDKDAMKQAGKVRLELKRIRCAAENMRKRLKERIVREGKAIDGIYNVLEFAILPLEEYCEKQEKYAAKLELERITRLREERGAELAGLDFNAPMDLGLLTEEAWQGVLRDAKELCELRQRRETEEARMAEERAKAEAEERQRQAAENERLKAEAEAARAAAAEAEKKLEAERAQAARAAQEAEEKARATALEAERKAEAERQRILREAEEAEARALAERNRLEEEALMQRKAAEAAQAKVREAERLESDRLANEAAKAEITRRAEEAAKRKAALAPDRERLMRVSQSVLEIQVPECATPEGKETLRLIENKLIEMSEWIEQVAAKL